MTSVCPASVDAGQTCHEPPFFPATDGVGGAYNPIGRYVALNLRKRF